MTRADKCLAYTVVLLSAWAICFVYADHWACIRAGSYAIKHGIPACASGKDDCRLVSCFGIPDIWMAHKESAR